MANLPVKSVLKACGFRPTTTHPQLNTAGPPNSFVHQKGNLIVWTGTTVYQKEKVYGSIEAELATAGIENPIPGGAFIGK